jgi:tetratricopeptide (TPR) repeat protein
MDNLVYAHLQLAQDDQARSIIDEMIEIKGLNPTVRTGPFAIAASEARYMLERHDWKGAASLQLRPSRFAYVDALTHFARALGAARSGDLDQASADIGHLAASAEKLREEKDSYWSEQVEIQKQVATAWLLHGQGKHDDALAAMSIAADAEDKTEKNIVTPGPLVPARELYGEMLLLQRNPSAALAQFEAVLKKEPNRFNAFAGAAASAEQAGDANKVMEYSQKLLALAGDGPTSRPAVGTARHRLTHH